MSQRAQKWNSYTKEYAGKDWQEKYPSNSNSKKWKKNKGPSSSEEDEQPEGGKRFSKVY